MPVACDVSDGLRSKTRPCDLIQLHQQFESFSFSHEPQKPQKPQETIAAPTECPFLNPELQKISDRHGNLASTGCTPRICQAGRAVHTDEPRVGENRALYKVEREAQDFLLELHREGFYASEEAYVKRCEQVREEINTGCIQGVDREEQCRTQLGGNWTQSSKELEFGLRRAWRNARKCIMRSHCQDLKLCDLRHILTSIEMATKLIESVSLAFDGGSIQPTVFVFPPRTINNRGPMVWNSQILQFAGYEAEDGSITGDPASVGLTKAILELGWQAPQPRGRWDLLPLVVMAEGDCPAMIDIPLSISNLIAIRHPHYMNQFESLDLKWVAFPALTRLGFDIGGVQYTAAPFIGWFMDAEIGVRNLADSFRYNVLPDVIEALDLKHGKYIEGIDHFDDFPEHEKLLMLSRAQAELNYAVHWSFLKAKVSMTDSLTASIKWSRYDDDFREKHGYRLPSDPYWLAPPQGSIIPVWHRGGAPNYQPKPMISRHVQDPVKAWAREKHCWPDYGAVQTMVLQSQRLRIPSIQADRRCSLIYEVLSEPEPPAYDILQTKTGLKALGPSMDRVSVGIYFCSEGIVAEKLASKLLRWTSALTEESPFVDTCSRVQPLNRLKDADLMSHNVLLLIVSSTGQGDLPINGSNFLELHARIASDSSSKTGGFRFAVFGNGDSRYSNTYNGAAIKVNAMMSKMGGHPLLGGVFHADTALDPLPLLALGSWWDRMRSIITAPSVRFQGRSFSVTSVEDPAQKYLDHQQDLLPTLDDGLLMSVFPSSRRGHDESLLISFNVGEAIFDEMSCVQILPSNCFPKANRALGVLDFSFLEEVDLDIDGSGITNADFFLHYVDLEMPFLDHEWLGELNVTYHTKEIFSKLSVLDGLELLRDEGCLGPGKIETSLRRSICLDMPLLHLRTYSVASLNHSSQGFGSLIRNNSREIDIMVKVYPGGRFSDTCINDSTLPTRLKYRIVDSVAGPLLRKNHMSPFVIVATGAGFGPVRNFLQWRISIARDARGAGQPLPPRSSSISLFLGLKECDFQLAIDVLKEAMSVDLIDKLDIVLSNPEKHRVYDNLPVSSYRIRQKLLASQGIAFVCTNATASKYVKSTIDSILGGTVKELLGERYVEEVF